MHRRLGMIVPWILIGMLGCAPTPTPHPPPSPPAPTERHLSLTVTNEAGPIAVTGSLKLDLEAAAITAEGIGRLTFTISYKPEESLTGASLNVEAPRMTPVYQRIIIPAEPDAELPAITLVSARPNAAEQGWIRPDNIRFVDEANRTWRMIGYSHFLLAGLHCSGADVDPLLDEPITHGYNTVRVLGMYAYIADFAGLPRLTADSDHYYLCIAELADLLARRGLRMEFVVFADAQLLMPIEADQQRHLRRVAEVLGGKWNVFLELVNEWQQNGVEPLRFSHPAVRVLSSRGSGVGDADPVNPAWDYVTDHPGRVAEWPRRMNCRDIAHAVERPCVENEPIGAAEVEQPGKRSGTPTDFTYWGAVCGMFAAGCTFHSDGGVLSRPLGPVQATSSQEFTFGLLWVPADAILWPYQRGDMGSDAGIGDMPILHNDALELRSYCKGNGHEEWCVQIRTVRGFATPRAGWVVREQPRRGLTYLVR